MPDEFDTLFNSPPDTADEHARGASRTRADDILDAVGGGDQAPAVFLCHKCGGSTCRVYRPIGGGVVERICLKCKAKQPMGSSPSTVAPTGRENIGPFYHGAASPSVSSEEPQYRARGQVRPRED